jgi:alkylation response protein AidB-like acyl-CoA dehydrogenase
MDFGLDETQLAIADLAKKVFAEKDAWPKLADVGLVGLVVPETEGGSGHGLLEACVLLEAQGFAASDVPLWTTLVASMAIAESGTMEQRQKYLSGVVKGQVISIALESAPMAARPEKGGLRLTGATSFVPSIDSAETLLVPARVGDATRLFFVSPKEARVERQVVTTGEAMGSVTLDTFVPADAALGDEVRGAAAYGFIHPRAVTLLCAMSIGVSAGALRRTAEYTSTRQQFDRPIATFQAVAQRAADAYIDLETMRVATWQAAWRLSQGLPAAHQVSLAKMWCSEAGHRVVYAAQHLHGGMGFELDYPLHRHYLMAKRLELSLGSATVHLEQMGKELRDANANL